MTPSLRCLQILAILFIGLFLSSCGGSSGTSGQSGGGVVPPISGGASDPSQLLYVPEFHSDGSEFIAWYPVTVSGNDPPPIATLNTTFFLPETINSLAVDPSGTLYSQTDGDTISVYAAGSSDNAPPVRTIKAPLVNGKQVTFIAIGTDAVGNLYATGRLGNSNTGVIAIYKPGKTIPDHELTGPQTALSYPTGVAFDREGRIVVVNRFGGACGPSGSVTVYAASATGDDAPIEFYNTDLNDPVGVAVDPQGNIYAVNATSAPSGVTVAVYPRASNNPAPKAVLNGPLSPEQQYVIGVDAGANVYIGFNGSIGVWPPITSWLSGGGTSPTRVIGLSNYIHFTSFVIH